MDIGILLSIALILLAAKIFGEIAERLKVSALVGEVFAGILLGPILLWVTPSPLLGQIANFGILFLLFIIGLETNFDYVKKEVYTGSYLAIAGCGLSFIFGFLVGLLIFNSVGIGVFLGFAILSTSTAITMRSLVDIGEFKTKIYNICLAIDIADEVLAILALSLLTAFLSYGSVRIWDVVGLFFAILGFFLLIITVGSKFIGRCLRVFQTMRDEQVIVAISLVIVFLVAFASENIGIAGVTGAFLAGVAMSKSHLTEPIIIPKMKIIGYGFFIPLFFAYSAVLMDINALVTSAGLIILLVAVGLVAKLIGAGFFAGLFNFDRKEQFMIGISMLPRGEYSILIAQIALGASILSKELYTVIIAFVLITVILTPIILRAMQKKGF
jgi:Kef-type K+ transport system membrane component KefB